MDYGLVLFTSDRGIDPASAAKLADEHGFTTFYVPEHTHIPIKREAAHPTTGDESLPDDRYMRTLDPWVSLGAACAVTSRVRLSTAVALPVEHDPITLAKSIATLDHLSGGRVSLGVGFGWNTDELADHNVPPGRRRTMLREYLEAMRALWTEEEAVLRGRVRQLRTQLGVAEAGAGAHPGAGRRCGHREELQVDRAVGRRLDHHTARLRHRRPGQAAAGHLGRGRARRDAPQIVALDFKPDPDKLARWAELGVTEVLFGLPDKSEAESRRLRRTARGQARRTRLKAILTLA